MALPIISNNGLNHVFNSYVLHYSVKSILIEIICFLVDSDFVQNVKKTLRIRKVTCVFIQKLCHTRIPCFIFRSPYRDGSHPPLDAPFIPHSTSTFPLRSLCLSFIFLILLRKLSIPFHHLTCC